ncbi:MAG: ATP-binding protein [Acidimicrobiales bacterium]
MASAEQWFTGEPASVSEARRFLRGTLEGWGADGLTDPAVQVLSELATNSVIHARTGFTVRVALDDGGGLRLEVVDGSTRPPAQKAHSREATTGRGLALVSALAASWGVDQDGQGKAVWALLRRAVPWQPGRAHADDTVEMVPPTSIDPGKGTGWRARLAA